METIFGQFGELVAKAKPDSIGFTNDIPTQREYIKVRTYYSGGDIYLDVKIGGGSEVSAVLTAEQATAIAASLMAQVQRIAELQTAEQ